MNSSVILVRLQRSNTVNVSSEGRKARYFTYSNQIVKERESEVRRRGGARFAALAQSGERADAERRRTSNYHTVTLIKVYKTGELREGACRSG